MDAAAQYLSRLPDEVRRAGGSLPARLIVAVLALALNIGFYLPSIPDGVPGTTIPGIDKAYHLLVLALTVWAAGRLLAPWRRFPIGWIVIVGLVHIGLIELVQGLALPDRSADPADLAAGGAGIVLGVAAWAVERRIRPRPDDDGLDGFDEPEDQGALEDRAGDGYRRR
ncbi:VanZ family protein [Brachybacterium sp. DNPG3]